MGKHHSKPQAHQERRRGFKEPDRSTRSVYITPPSQLVVSTGAGVCAAYPLQPPSEKRHRSSSIGSNRTSERDPASIWKALPPGMRSSDAAHGKRASVAESESVQDGGARRPLLLGMVYVSMAVLIIFIAEYYMFAALSIQSRARKREIQRNGTVDDNGPTTLRSGRRSGLRRAQNASVKNAPLSFSEDTETERFEDDRSTSVEDFPQVSSGD